MDLLDIVTSDLKKNPSYLDVKSSYFDFLHPQEIEKTCPYGCQLIVPGEKDGKGKWRFIEGTQDSYKQILICKTHGYARIYVATGLDILHAGQTIND